MKEELAKLRTQIDEVDRQMIDLLAQRKKWVQKIGQLKTQAGFPVYLPDREQNLIQARRQEAEQKGVSSDLVEDILRRIIRESYKSEEEGFRCTRPEAGPIVLVGGLGGMGTLFRRYLQGSHYEVRCLDKDDWARVEQIIEGASLVIVSVPIDLTMNVLEKLEPYLQPHMILADLTSTKKGPVEAMLRVHSGPVLGLHPMFGPTTGVMAKQVIACCPVRDPGASTWVLEQFRIWGAQILWTNPEEHDEMMAYIQAMRHFATFVYGAFIAESNPNLHRMLAFSSPIYRMELAMVGRLFAQSPELYADIIMSNPDMKNLADRFQTKFSEGMETIQSKDREAFIQAFNRVREWFGPTSQQFLAESTFMIERSQDHL